jgi:thiol-disulfide isomerase/thioredoxin
LDDIDGQEFHLAEHLGEKVLLLNFWATWCEPCRIEMPHLDRLQRTYRDVGLEILCISMDGPESVSQVRNHVGRYGYAFSVLVDMESEVTQLYNPRRAAPFNALIDRSGTVVWSHEGYAPGDETELEEQLRRALEAE